jgi:hypothetical protein
VQQVAPRDGAVQPQRLVLRRDVPACHA